MSKSKYAAYSADFYGKGKLVQELEQRMAELLGKPKATFCHKGMVGQLSVIKHWTQKFDSNRIAFQPSCHMDVDEESAYRELLHLDSVYLGSNQGPLSDQDIQIAEGVSVVSIELPHRRAGFLLPQWPTLQALQEHCAASSTALHFDGARLFESAPYWNKTPAQVCTLCDSVYVSLYKMFGALAGGIVAADEDTIDAIQPWITRMGGNLHTLFPYAISAMMGLDQYLPRIQEFVEKGQHVAKLAVQVLGQESLPFDVQTNSFILHLPHSPQEVTTRALELAEQHKVWLFDSVTETSDGKSKVEVQIGDALDLWIDGEIESCLARFQ